MIASLRAGEKRLPEDSLDGVAVWNQRANQARTNNDPKMLLMYMNNL